MHIRRPITASRAGICLRSRTYCAAILSLVGLGLCDHAALFAAAQAPAMPNVIFILADDLGWRDLGCYGSSFYETPNIDQLAASGIRYTNAYAAACVCSPSRASIMTGKYPARLGITDWLPGRPDNARQKLRRPALPDHLSLSELTIGEAFKAAGYVTGFVGKWHLGGEGFLPQDQGFDVSVAADHRGAPSSYFSPYKIPSLPDGPAGEYLTDRLTDEAIKFIEQAKSRPFFLFLSHYAVHNPQQAKKALVEKYSAKLSGLPVPAGPEFRPEGDNLVRQIQNQPVYAAMVESLDQSVGRVMKHLQESGLEQNTIIVFTSDNGGVSTAEGHPTSNVPLRAGKGWNYEGGVREPLIIRWPSRAAAGRVSEKIVIGTDFYPTLLEAAGLPSHPEQHLDGVNILGSLSSHGAESRSLFWHYPHYSNQGGKPSSAIRNGDLKLVEWLEDGRVELFNLKDDPEETRDLSKKAPAEAARLLASLHDWRQRVGARLPTPNPDYGH
jgi:arylsulfatase A-like enzyme